MAVSVLVAIRHRMTGRSLEWYVATQMLLWGIVLLAPEASFNTSVVFDHFPLDENDLGSIMLALGVLRIGALIINGAVPHVTPFFRIGGAFIGIGVWFFISINLLASGHISTWIAAWPMALIAEFVSLFKASQDARVGVSKVTQKFQRAHGGRS